MSNSRALLMSVLVALVSATAWAQASPEPLGSDAPISDIDRMTRERDTNKRFFSNEMARLNLTFDSSGDLRSELIKNELHGLFMTVEVNGDQIKRIAKTEKPKVQEAVKPGPMTVKGRWARPGTRRYTTCVGELVIGFQHIVFLPYGGVDGFSCHIEMRNLPDEVYDEWKASFDADQTEAYGNCGSQHPRGSADFWKCIDSYDLPFPDA